MSRLPPPLSLWALRGLLLAYLVPTLLALAVVTPPWQNPDEFAHMLRAVQVAHGGLFGRRDWGSMGGDSDPAIYKAYEPIQSVAMHPERRMTREALAASGTVGWHGTTIYTPYPTAEYPAFFYIPDALAYWAGRAGRLSVNHTLLLARAANAAAFALVVAVALGRARRSFLPLAALLLLPTSLALAASANQDSLLLASMALVVATLDRAIAEGRATTRNETISLAVLLAIVGMARPPYAGFLLSLGLTQRRGAAPLLAAAMATLAWCAAVAAFVAMPRGQADAHAQLALLAANPGSLPRIAVATLATFGTGYVAQMIGVLGSTDTRLPHAYLVASCLVLGLAALAGTCGPARRPVLPLAGASFAVLAIFVLQYFTWTWPGQPYVTGVLGRYFLPVAMVLALALPSLKLPPRPMFLVAAAALCLQALATPAVMLHALVFRFYVS